MTESSLTQDYIKSILDYNPITGIFTWKVKKAHQVRIGTEAGWDCRKGYRRIMIDNIAYRSARLAFLYMNGVIPEQADHINQIRNDNRWINLRAVTNSENLKNKPIYKNNKSGIAGVAWNKRQKEWRVSVGQHNLIYRGDDFFEACCIRKSGEIEYGYHKNHGNKKCRQ